MHTNTFSPLITTAETGGGPRFYGGSVRVRDGAARCFGFSDTAERREIKASRLPPRRFVALLL